MLIWEHTAHPRKEVFILLRQPDVWRSLCAAFMGMFYFYYCTSDGLAGVQINLNFMAAHRTSYVKILLVLLILVVLKKGEYKYKKKK